MKKTIIAENIAQKLQEDGYEKFDKKYTWFQKRTDFVDVEIINREKLQSNVKIISKYIENPSFGARQQGGHDEINLFLEALRDFGYDTYFMSTFDNYTTASYVEVIRFTGDVIQRHSDDADFFDVLRELESAITELLRIIRSINDKDRSTPEIRAAKAYLISFQEFLTAEENRLSVEIPPDVSTGLLGRLKGINWIQISEQAQKWADTITKILLGFLK